MTDIRTAAMNLPAATVVPTTVMRTDADTRLLKKIHSIRPVLLERERAAATIAKAALGPAL